MTKKKEFHYNFIEVDSATATEDVRSEYISLDEMQQFVGGYIEMVESADSRLMLVCNEEGKLLGLPVNVKATQIAHAHSMICVNDYICGNAIVADRDCFD
jgi:hypothetical protein